VNPTPALDRRPRTPEAPHPAYRYHLLRAGLERYQRHLGELDTEQMREVERQAQRTFALESLVLSSQEARGIFIPETRLDDALAEVKGRYPDADAFEHDLRRNGIDEEDLRHALRRELLFDAVLQRVGSSAAVVDEVEERLFFELHPERFTLPERRQARHILITVNEAYTENQRAVAQARIERLREILQADLSGFDEAARRHSECPTAMDGGRLGLVRPGQLFPTLDACLFDLDEGTLSGVLESELGFHLLYCERIEPGGSASFEQARTQIRETLHQRRVQHLQKEWIAALRRDLRSSA
jgi:peptidyl-prolyl cis-trans isomerase C